MISLRDVSFRYPRLLPDQPPQTLFANLDFEIGDDMAFAVLGASGEGKSTLLHIMAGLVPRHTGGKLLGQVVVNDVDVKKAIPSVGAIGSLFQDAATQLFNTTVEMEIAWGLEAQTMPPADIGDRVAIAMHRFGLSDLRHRRPWTLSGGEQKRLALAALWAMNPTVWLLDEPLGGLDAFGRRDVINTLHHLQDSGSSLVCATHRPEMLAICECGIILDSEHPIPIELGEAAGENSLLSKHGILYPTVQWPDFKAHQTRPTKIVISLEHVCFDYPEQGSLLQDVTLDICKGESVTIIGRNGAGKSTLLRHLNGLLRPNQGDIRINGASIADKQPGEIARDVGFLFQRPEKQFFASTVIAEVSSGPRWMNLPDIESRVEKSLARFDLSDVAHLPPTALSYGQQRAVTLAALAATNPEIIALDEPTVGLDGRGLEQLITWLAELHANDITTIIITHELEWAARSDYVIWLDQGHVMGAGSPSVILPQYQRMLL